MSSFVFSPSLQVIDCGSLNPPQNGEVQFDSTVFGSIATYQCNRGFRLQGSEARTCQENSKWSGREPMCIKSAIFCPDLSSPANGRVSVSGLRPGSTADYSCEPGYSLRGVETRVCQNNGKWSDNEPTCIGKNFSPG